MDFIRKICDGIVMYAFLVKLKCEVKSFEQANVFGFELDSRESFSHLTIYYTATGYEYYRLH